MDSPPEVTFFTLKGSWLGLYALDTLARDVMVPSVSHGFKAFTLSHNLYPGNEVDKVIENAMTAGAILSKRPQKTPWGGCSGYFKEPGENL